MSEQEAAPRTRRGPKRIVITSVAVMFVMVSPSLYVYLRGGALEGQATLECGECADRAETVDEALACRVNRARSLLNLTPWRRELIERVANSVMRGVRWRGLDIALYEPPRPDATR